jgi:Dimethlysulfonioproprionate lyase
MTDPRDLLYSPLGGPGSGRVRYGAAMALWREGRISEAALEVYRIASAHDGRDPLPMLEERGLPQPPGPAAPSALPSLYAAARDYILALAHPGAEEVRAALPPDPGAERTVSPRANAVVDRWLGPALGAVQDTQPDLAETIARAAPALNWVTYDRYPRALIGEAFATGHAFASILGIEAPFRGKDVDLGLFLIAPGTLYRDHRHAAPELYAPLTGPHGWRFAPEDPIDVKPAHVPVWNPAFQHHLTLVGPVPFLGFFVWTRDVEAAAEVIPSDDWARLERLGLTGQ